MRTGGRLHGPRIMEIPMNAQVADGRRVSMVDGQESVLERSTPGTLVSRVGTSGRFHPECAICPARRTCLPYELQPAEVRLLDFVVASRRPVRRGQVLYRAGDPMEAIYAIRAGFFKTVVVSSSGREQVTGLRMPGDVLGCDGMHGGYYACDAFALDHGEVCVVPLHNLLVQSLHNEALLRAFYAVLSRELWRKQEQMLLLGGMWGIQRVATFLIDISRRMQAQGYSPSEFELRLTRREIGSYLGMELETASRMISRLEREGLIVADRQHIKITDRERLEYLSTEHSRLPPDGRAEDRVAVSTASGGDSHSASSAGRHAVKLRRTRQEDVRQ